MVFVATVALLAAASSEGVCFVKGFVVKLVEYFESNLKTDPVLLLKYLKQFAVFAV